MADDYTSTALPATTSDYDLPDYTSLMKGLFGNAGSTALQYTSQSTPQNAAQSGQSASDSQMTAQKDVSKENPEWVKIMSSIGESIAQKQKEADAKTRPISSTPFREEDQPTLDLSRYGRVERDVSGNIVGLSGKEIRDEKGKVIGKTAPDWTAQKNVGGELKERDVMNTPMGLDAFYQKNPQLKKPLETRPTWETDQAKGFANNQQAGYDEARAKAIGSNQPQSRFPSGTNATSTTTEKGSITSISSPYGYAVGSSGAYSDNGTKDLMIGFAKEDQKNAKKKKPNS